MKTLNVKETSLNELKRQWSISVMFPASWENFQLFIRCNRNGEVNWDVAPVYTANELISRNNVNILK